MDEGFDFCSIHFFGKLLSKRSVKHAVEHMVQTWGTFVSNIFRSVASNSCQKLPNRDITKNQRKIYIRCTHHPNSVLKFEGYTISNRTLNKGRRTTCFWNKMSKERYVWSFIKRNTFQVNTFVS